MQDAKAIMLTYIQFEKIVSRIFESYGFETKIQSEEYGPLGPAYYPFDILAKKAETNYLMEVKFSRANRASVLRLTETAAKLSAFISSDQCHLQKCVPVLVIGATIKPELRQKIQEYSVTVIDIQNLLFLVNDNDDLKSELLSILEFSVNDILPEKPATDIFEISNVLPVEKPKKEVKTKAEYLLERISQWVVTGENAKRRSSAYEKLCHDILKYLFDDELSLWHTQQKSNDDLYRFDLICKIKDGNVSGLWTTILQCFNTKYVIFEFKNYTEQITQKEVYTTDKYLYLKALRGVAIIVSCKGASPNANKAIRGTLRENGKLILSIDNSDLCEMIRIKMNDGTPADYLYSKFDDLLIDLEK